MSTRVSTPSSTRSCGDLSVSHSSRWDEVDLWSIIQKPLSHYTLSPLAVHVLPSVASGFVTQECMDTYTKFKFGAFFPCHIWQAELTFIHFFKYTKYVLWISEITILDIRNSYSGYPKIMQNKYFILDIQKRILNIQNNYFWYPEKKTFILDIRNNVFGYLK